jgi:hypothetical protein
MIPHRFWARRTCDAARVHQRCNAGCEDPALSWLLRRQSEQGAAHETTNPVQAVRSICCTGYCAAVTTCSDALQVSKHAERSAVGGDLIPTFTGARCAAGALS